VRSVFERLRPVDQGDGRTPVWTWLLHALPRPDGLLPGAEIIAGIIGLILRVLAGLRIVLYPAVYSQDAFAEMMPALRRLSICENRCE